MGYYFNYVNFTDLYMLPIWLGILYVLTNAFYKNRVEGTPEAKYFWPGFWYTVIGAQVIFVVVAIVIGGDLFAYYRSAKGLTNLLITDPGIFLYPYERLLGQFDSGSELRLTAAYRTVAIPYLFDLRAIFTSYISTPFYMVSNGSILSMILQISILSFISKWLLFKRLLDYYPGAARYLNLSVILLPSMIAWATLIYKETYCIICLCLIFYLVADNKSILSLELNRIARLLFAIFLMWLIVGMKPYILYSFLPFLLYFRFGSGLVSNLSTTLRPVVNVFVVLIVFGTSTLILNVFASALGEYSLDGFAETARIKTSDLTSDYYYTDQESGGSRYYIGDFDPTYTGLLSKFPIATFTALFRPLPYDVNSFQVALSALESTAILGLALYVLVRIGPFAVIRILLSNPLIFFMLFYSISFGFVVALSSGNFGNLTRYRSPMMLFFVSSLFLFLEEYRVSKMQKDAQRAQYFESQKERLGVAS